jgi:putative NIF3 family GTP cyclohydrolase 1 type 2
VGLNIVYGGHYATETAGLKALAEHLVGQFGLETVFLDLPTGA